MEELDNVHACYPTSTGPSYTQTLSELHCLMELSFFLLHSTSIISSEKSQLPSKSSYDPPHQWKGFTESIMGAQNDGNNDHVHSTQVSLSRTKHHWFDYKTTEV